MFLNVEGREKVKSILEEKLDFVAIKKERACFIRHFSKVNTAQAWINGTVIRYAYVVKFKKVKKKTCLKVDVAYRALKYTMNRNW